MWCALDDVSIANGCLVLQPGSHRQVTACSTKQCQEDARQSLPQQNAQPAAHFTPRQGQGKQQPCCSHLGGVPLALEVSAGTVIITSDRVLHASGPNETQHFRRAWMPQFAAGSLTWRNTGLPVSLAIPLQPNADVGHPAYAL